MNSKEFAKFEKEAGYKSLASSLEEPYEAFDKLKTEYDLEAWQNKYQDIVEYFGNTGKVFYYIICYSQI